MITPDNQPTFELVKWAIALDLNFKNLHDQSADLTRLQIVSYKGPWVDQSFQLLSDEAEPFTFDGAFWHFDGVPYAWWGWFPRQSIILVGKLDCGLDGTWDRMLLSFAV